MQIQLDIHTHTLASAHAYSTILENARVAADRGLSLLAITDHAPCMDDSTHLLHFVNYDVLDRVVYGVEMLYGVELDIIDYSGSVSMAADMRQRMDICIASFHNIVFPPGSKAENTRAYLGAMEQSGVAIIGHPDDGRVPVDYEALIREAKRVGILIELNNSSLKPGHFRVGARENTKTYLALCERYGVPVAIGSDAHFATAVGNLNLALELLEEIQFPAELVINTDPAALKQILEHRR
ncbi:MAG: phosphatase [Oscillospiraceae bacterium]|nr:phosphatase [Oscillospiraceae bacterium]